MKTKICSRCGQYKPVSEFYLCPSAKSGYRCACRVCEALSTRQKFQKDPQKQRDQRKQRRLRPDYKPPPSAKNWKKAHPEKVAEEYQRRRKREIVNGNRLSPKDRKEIFEKYGGRCLSCGTTEKIGIDHIVPLMLGGKNDLSNIQLLCCRCNSRKALQIIDYRPRENQ